MELVNEEAYVLCSCETFEAQVWPEEGGIVEAKSWNPYSQPSGGLFGLLWGNGIWNTLLNSMYTDWAVVKVNEYLNMGGYVKFPSGEVVFRGSHEDAVKKIVELGARGGVVCENMKVDDSCYGIVGDCGTIEGGKSSFVVAGDYGLSRAGEFGTAITGDEGKSVVKKMGAAFSGDYGKSIVEEGEGVAFSGHIGEAAVEGEGLAVAGIEGKALSGERGLSLSLDYGKSSVEDYGIALTGSRGVAKAGKNGILVIKWFDRTVNRVRLAVGYVGENGIKEDTWYRVDNDGTFTEYYTNKFLKEG